MKKTNLLKITLVSSVSMLLFACSSDHSQPNVELIQDMMSTKSIKAQEYDEAAPNGISARVPPDHTEPIGFEPYRYTNIDEAAKNLKNPLAGNMTQEVMLTGQRYYEINCALCHGHKGEGSEKSTIAQQMALKPPTLLSAKVKGWNDAQIYHTITIGQGLMGPYASHIPQKYRWQVVNYIRHLQK